MLLLFREKHILGNVRQKFHNEGIIYKIEQLWLNLWSEYHIELGDVAHLSLISYGHLVLFSSNVLTVPLNSTIRF